VEQLRLTLSSVETQLRYAKNTREISLNMLKLLMGFPTKAPLELVDTLESLTTDGLFEQKFESKLTSTTMSILKLHPIIYVQKAYFINTKNLKVCPDCQPF